MIEFVSENNKKHLILFIHGFTGDNSTWQGSFKSFPAILSEESEIIDECDIAYFSYYTQLLNTFSKSSNLRKIIKKCFPTSTEKLKKNSSIEEIANLLKTEVRFRLQNYDSIIFIAHSMGGLVAKCFIVDEFDSGQRPKTGLFISLAVPHMGANAAVYGNLISSNIQIENLTPLNQLIHSINDRWLKSDIRPPTKYFYGVHDGIVQKTSASPTDKEISDVISVDEDHSSIGKPENKKSTVVIAVKDLILAHLNDEDIVYGLPVQTLTDDAKYQDEIFVIKLLMADIHQSSVKQAKEVFLNAEYARKFFKNDTDQSRLLELFQKVKKIYSDCYIEYVHGGISNSGLLLAKVHQKIMEQDKEFLGTMLPYLNAIHKQGMLHQLANQLEDDIWWSDKTGTALIDEFLRESNK